jgi:hypothetical protein
VQCVAAPESVKEHHLKLEDAVEIVGRVRREVRAKSGYETIVLPGSEVGELAAFARRKGDTWFLAVICGPQAKTMRVPLSFLGDGEYNSVVVHDDAASDAPVEVGKATQKAKRHPQHRVAARRWFSGTPFEATVR